MELSDLCFEEFNAAQFRLYENNPVIRRFGPSPVVADPSVLTPEQSHDGKWHLFCHTIIGVYRFESADGVDWTNSGLVVRRAMRPDVNVIDGEYFLYYERLQPLVRKGLAMLDGKWFSEIYLVKSKDLKSWSKPVKIIGSEIPYALSGKSVSVSNPFLIRVEGKYRLYFSAGLTYIEDCKFSEPTYISYAESGCASEGFTALEEPVLRPDKNSDYLNICCGCIKVYKLKDCFIGLQNGIYADKNGDSHSVIMLLKSSDGKKFEFVKPLLEPRMCGESNWMAQYVYACNLVLFKDKLYLYFNARNYAAALKGAEHIGVATADLCR